MINVGLVETSYTHIENQMPGALKRHCYPYFPHPYLAYKVKVESGSYLADILGATDFYLNSLHHQDTKDIPSALNPVAYISNGLVEALVLVNLFLRLASSGTRSG